MRESGEMPRKGDERTLTRQSTQKPDYSLKKRKQIQWRDFRGIDHISKEFAIRRKVKIK